ncbi:MAG TPA: DUF983 domain-containing protein [Bacteroidia bacterium]|jgi:uncharacterized protein (DUF983 family)|nr:DUF983 domain-containing protein [Bacteroidia bacterium]
MLKETLKLINPFRKGTKLYSIVKLKCPRCQEGNLFLTQNPYNLKMFDKMPDKCTVCGEDFLRESGFYWGGMMVSHATTTVVAVIVHLIVYFFAGWEITPNIISIVAVILLIFPVVFRNSRAIWINFFVDYNPTTNKNEKM